jgi:hypothetical protein
MKIGTIQVVRIGKLEVRVEKKPLRDVVFTVTDQNGLALETLGTEEASIQLAMLLADASNTW